MGFYLLDELGPGHGGVGEFGFLSKGQGNLSWSCSYLLSLSLKPFQFHPGPLLHPEALYLPTSVSLCPCLPKDF